MRELTRLADVTSSRLRARGLVAGCVAVKIRRNDFRTFTRQRRIAPATNETRTIANIARDLLGGWLREQPRARLRLLGVAVRELQSAGQLDLFNAARPHAASSALDDAIDAIRQRFGPGAVTRSRVR
jgi:DNA polymerase-4